MSVNVYELLKWLATGWALSSIPERGGTLCLYYYVQTGSPVVAEGLSVRKQKDDISLNFFVLLVLLVLYVYSFLLVSCSRRPYLFTIWARYFIILCSIVLPFSDKFSFYISISVSSKAPRLLLISAIFLHFYTIYSLIYILLNIPC
jgi:hypothetical protein